MKSVEVQLNEALEKVKNLEKENGELKTAVHQKQITIASLQRDSRLKASGLPPDAVKRLNEAFAQSTDNAGLKQAINCERKQHGQHN